MGDPSPAAEYIQILSANGRQTYSVCGGVGKRRTEHKATSRKKKKKSDRSVCLQWSESKQNHRVGVVCTDVVASAITLIMQSTVVCTLVHMTEKGSTIDPEGFRNTKELNFARSVSQEEQIDGEATM